MTIARAAFYVAALFGAAAVSGCGTAVQQPAAPTASWMSSDAKSTDLLYLSDVQTNDVYVFSYPAGKLVGTLSGFGAPRGECVDPQGNVWIADEQGYDVIEYAHGATKPITALSTPWAPGGCSARSQTVAVAGGDGGDGGTILAVFHHSAHNRWRDATKYTDASIRAGYYCGYDAHGNLFVDGVDKTKGAAFRLAELSRRGKSLANVTVTQSIAAPGQVQWDGEHLAIGDTGVSPSVLYQFSVKRGGATQVGSTVLDGTKSVRQFWIDGTRVVGPDYDSSAGIWKYPAGGSPIDQITTVHAYGAVVSAAASSGRK